MAMRDRHTVMNAGRVIMNRLLRLPNRHRGQHINRITENNGRSMPLPGQLNLPANIVGFASVNGWIGERLHTIGQRPAPLRPIAQCLRAGLNARVTGKGGRCEQTTEQRNIAQRGDHAHILDARHRPCQSVRRTRDDGAALRLPRQRRQW